MRGGRSASTLPLIMRFSADNAGGFQSVHKGTRINEALEAVKGLRDSYRAMLCNVPQGRLKITEIAQDAVLGIAMKLNQSRKGRLKSTRSCWPTGVPMGLQPTLSCTISAQLCVRYRLGFRRQLKVSWRNMADPQLLSFT